MELRQLRYFVEVARALNFTRAAEKLRVAQPALSRQIRALEEELGVKLLERDQRHVTLTPSGTAFLTQAESLLAQSNAAIQAARSSSTTPERRLSLGYVWGLFHTLAPARIQQFRQAEPDVAVHLFDLSATEQAAALKKGTIDAGFIGLAHEADSAGLDKQKIATSHLVAVLPRSHPQSRKAKVSLAGMHDELFLAISEAAFPGALGSMMEACARAGFKPKVVQTAERGHTLLALVGANCGIALLPEPLKALPHEGVVFRELAEPVPADLFLAWNPSRKPALLEEFLAACDRAGLDAAR